MRLGADLLQVDAQTLQNAGRDAFSFSEQADQQVLRSDIGVVHPAGLVDGQLHDLLGPGGEADLALRRALAPSDDELDGRAHLGQVNAQPRQHSSGYALGLPYQAKQDVLGPDVVVVEPLRFFLGQGQNPPCPF